MHQFVLEVCDSFEGMHFTRLLFIERNQTHSDNRCPIAALVELLENPSNQTRQTKAQNLNSPINQTALSVSTLPSQI